MLGKNLPVTEIDTIDRAIEEGVAKVMTGAATDFSRVADLSARRVEMTQSKTFEKIEVLIGRSLDE
jgi:hypothetical protein